MEINNENKEIYFNKNHKIVQKNVYYSAPQDFLFNIENSDLNTNYEKSNFSNENFTGIQNNQAIIEEKIFKIKTILQGLKQSKAINLQIQKILTEKYEKLNEKQITIEKTIEKIKRINKSKQKKHIKYLKYTPLNKVYYYCPKKIHYYYILMDLVIKSRKKNKQSNNSIHFSLGGNNSNVSKKRDINRFKFNKKEDSILKKNLLFSFSPENIDWFEIAKETQIKNAFQVFVRSLELSNFYAYKKWNTIEDNILRKAILYYGPKNWQQISYCLDGRNNSQCFHRWMKGINPKIKRNKWSFDEDLTLGVALRIYGNKKWSKIANHLNGRTDIQCRERFCNILDPNLEEVEWKNSEDIKLLSLYEKYGNKWSKIAKEFGNRTDNTCWRRWKYLISIKSFGPGINNGLNDNFKFEKKRINSKKLNNSCSSFRENNRENSIKPYFPNFDITRQKRNFSVINEKKEKFKNVTEKKVPFITSNFLKLYEDNNKISFVDEYHDEEIENIGNRFKKESNLLDNSKVKFGKNVKSFEKNVIGRKTIQNFSYNSRSIEKKDEEESLDEKANKKLMKNKLKSISKKKKGKLFKDTKKINNFANIKRPMIYDTRKNKDILNIKKEEDNNQFNQITFSLDEYESNEKKIILSKSLGQKINKSLFKIIKNCGITN